MGEWNYRRIKTLYVTGTLSNIYGSDKQGNNVLVDEIEGIHEVYYEEMNPNRPRDYTDQPVDVSIVSTESGCLVDIFRHMEKAFDLPIIYRYVNKLFAKGTEDHCDRLVSETAWHQVYTKYKDMESSFERT